MTNGEKYKNEIINPDGRNFCHTFLQEYVLPTYGMDCDDISCENCRVATMLWLQEEYKEPETDWTQVPVDTLVEVWDIFEKNALKRYFAKFKDGKIWCWQYGATSVTADGNSIVGWEHGRIVKEEKTDEE